MANTITVQYQKSLTSFTIIEGAVEELATTFATVQQRTSVDDAMIDALVAAANGLAASATALKSITYTPPQP
jgi:hypothetical protein